MKKISDLKAYEIVQEKDLPELHGKGYLLSHIKTKARVLVVENDDINKVFNIGFRTPPYDDSGIPHILEHSVLCGSKKYPVKDPFVELAKGSLNTFLNAMTYSDKTVYPIASFNEKDFENIMSVYLDAVFYPDIYIHDEIMKQEGWHYELDDVDGQLKYNGVVFNEMKGVYSNPDSIMYRAIETALFSDTPYGFESGGDPEAIPTLTQERFRQFHSTYYHPSNSYIYLYGDCDMAKQLEFIDEEYLSNFDYKEVDSSIALQTPFEEMKDVEINYSIADTDSEEKNSMLTYNKVVGLSTEKKKVIAMGILDYALMDAPGAPLKKALTDAGIGDEIFSSFDSGCQQISFSIMAKGADAKDKDRFIEVVENTLRQQSEGMDREALVATINKYEFKHKEANFGRYPKGLMYGLKAFNSWLYDDDAAMMFFELNDVYRELKEDVNDGYFEKLIKENILENNFGAYVTLNPKKGLDREKERLEAEKLAAYKSTLSQQELEKIVEDTKALKKYQETPSAPEDLAKVPLLEISDISKEAEKINNQVGELEGIPVVGHDIFTNGIGYLKFYFEINDFEERDYTRIALLSTLFRYIDTENYTYGELSKKIDANLGGIDFDVVCHSNEDITRRFFCATTKALYEKLPTAVDLIKEIMLRTKLDDKKRLRELLAEERSAMKNVFASSGHITASTRVMSYINENARFTDLTTGVDYYQFLSEVLDNFDDRADELIEKLKALLDTILAKSRLTISYTGDEALSQEVNEKILEFAGCMKQRTGDTETMASEAADTTATGSEVLDTTVAGSVTGFVRDIKNEGFATASQVQYVAIGGNFTDAGYKYDSALEVLKVIFSYGYLWENVRVKGGAYGAMCSFGLDGGCYMTSYRDPNLMETYEIFKEAYKYVENFTCSDRDMTKYIIGTVAQLDAPLTPQADGVLNMTRYFMGVTDQEIQKNRDRILGTDCQVIRSLAPMVKAVTDFGMICAVGGEDKLKSEKDNFKEIKNI